MNEQEFHREPRRAEDVSYPRDVAERKLRADAGHSLDDLARRISLQTYETVSVREPSTGEHSQVFLRGKTTGQRPYLSK